MGDMGAALLLQKMQGPPGDMWDPPRGHARPLSLGTSRTLLGTRRDTPWGTPPPPAGDKRDASRWGHPGHSQGTRGTPGVPSPKFQPQPPTPGVPSHPSLWVSPVSPVPPPHHPNPSGSLSLSSQCPPDPQHPRGPTVPLGALFLSPPILLLPSTQGCPQLLWAPSQPPISL